MNVAFLNENTMGHASYLLPFARQLEEYPELGVTPWVIDATPLPPHLEARARSIRGLRKFDLDFHNLRGRMAVSRYAEACLRELMAQRKIDAVVANTQTVTLALHEVAEELPVFVCLDATFRQLGESPWFAPNWMRGLLLPLTARQLYQCERKIFDRASRLLAWSEEARESLLQDYAYPPARVSVLPPSIDLRRRRPLQRNSARRQILFVGGDFRRKGGPLLLDCYRRWFRDEFDLHVVTRSAVAEEPGVFVHHGVEAFSPAWYERWNAADAFVFPSALETFGIVLLEALAFEVPVISTSVGAARSILAQGDAGWLLRERTPEALRDALREIFGNPSASRQRAIEGRRRVEKHFDLCANTRSLVGWLQEAIAGRQFANASV